MCPPRIRPAPRPGPDCGLRAAGSGTFSHDCPPGRTPHPEGPTAREGYLPNRARLITAAALTRHLGIHWTIGERYFARLLVDGDLASNAGNWQWIAGTGNDTRPNRRFSLLRQAHRFDPAGDYVRRYVPELAGIDGAAVHEPWRLRAARYPPPLPQLGLGGDR